MTRQEPLISHLRLPLQSRWLPADLSSDRRVLVVLHGMGDSFDSFVDIRCELGLGGVNLLLLNAPKRYGDGFSWYRLEPRHRAEIRENRGRLLSCVAELERLGFSPRDQVWLGHSQGGLMAVDLALNSPSRFAGVVAVSSYFWPFRGWREAAMSLQTPVLFTHGTHDRVLPLDQTRHQVGLLRSFGAPVELEVFAKGHDFDMQREVGHIGRWVRRSWPQVVSMKRRVTARPQRARPMIAGTTAAMRS